MTLSRATDSAGVFFTEIKLAENVAEKIEIEKLAQGGDGLGHLSDGRVVFVRGAVPGDVVDVELETDKKRWARGRVSARRESSQARTSVECDAFERGCGGCQYWGVDYESEIKWKADAAREAIERISGLDLPRPEVVAAPSVWDYRSRVTLHQRRVDDSIQSGFYEAGSRRIVELDRCPVARSEIDGAIAEFSGVLSILGNADIGIETTGDGGAVLLIELGSGERIKRPHLEEIARHIDQGTGVRGAELLDEEENYYVIGDTTVDIAEVLAQPPVEGMRVESGRFRQANKEINRRLVAHVAQRVAEGWENPRILELYCGSGNFSFALAENAERLVGFEMSRGAVETARRIAELAEDIDHLSFDVADLDDPDAVAKVLAEPFEVLVLDPPREGAAEVARQLASSERQGQIIYVSCDAACLARDLKTLAGAGWRLQELSFFDLFPRTAHLEVVAVMDR